MLLYSLGGLFLLISWVAPNHYPPWTSFHGEAAAFFSLILLSFHRSFPKGAAQSNILHSFFFSIIVIILLQFAFGLIFYIENAVLGTIYTAGIMMAWWLGKNSQIEAVRDEKILMDFSKLICTGAVISIILAILQWLNMDADIGIFIANRGPGMRPFGNFAQPNHLGTFCLMAVASACVLHSHRKISPHLLLILLTLFAFGMAMTESRTAIFSLICMTLFWALLRKKTQSSKYGYYIAFFWLIFLTLYFSWGALNDLLLLQDTRQVALTKDSIRLTFWAQFWKAITLAPWEGYGWHQGILEQQTGAQWVSGELGTVYAHNAVLDLVAWFGIPISAILLSIFAASLITLVKKINCPSEFWILCGTIPFFTHSLLEFPFAYAYFIFPIAWMLGYLNGTPISSKKQIFKTYNLTILTGYSIICLLVWNEYLAIEEDYRVMRFELRQLGTRPINHQDTKTIALTQLGATLHWGRFIPNIDTNKTDAYSICRIASVDNWVALQLKCAISLYFSGKKPEAVERLNLIKSIHGDEVFQSAIRAIKNMSTNEYKNSNLIEILPASTP